MPTLLVVDDDPVVLQCFRMAFTSPEIDLLTAATAAEGLEIVARRQPDAIVLDIELPDLSGLEMLRRIRQLDRRIPAIVITGRGTTATAIEAMTLGAYEYLLKPFEVDEVRELVNRAFAASRLMRIPAVLEEPAPDASKSELLLGRCPAMQAVYKLIGRVAPQDVTVLVLGESGTGKELVARAIYHYSQRAAGPFLAINCAAIPEALLESELFGHEKGAFTGADRKRIGKFEQASGGTVLLDEIGDMTPLTQAKILRLLQDQQFERLGGNQVIRTNVRVIAATNRDLERMVAAGQFRGDLYYRLNTCTIQLPLLRERGDDLPLLASHFLERFNREFKKQIRLITPEALDLLIRYEWPGNVRELQSVVKQAVLLAADPILLPEHLPLTVRNVANRNVAKDKVTAPSSPPAGLTELERFVQERLQKNAQDLYAEWLALTDRLLFTQVLRHTDGNLSQAARILGLHRTTLRSRLTALGIGIPRPNLPGDDQTP